MKVSNGRIHRALPGPSIIPDKVLQAMQRPAPNIYGGELEEITMSILSDISKLAGSKGRVALYISNGHGVWEAALTNLFNEDDKILTISNGVFGKHWGNIASKLLNSMTSKKRSLRIKIKRSKAFWLFKQTLLLPCF